MRNDIIERLAFTVIGATAGFLFAKGFIAYQDANRSPMTCVEVQQDYDAYRMCMQSMGSLGCTMAVEDFARYRELERELEECPND